MTQETVDQAAQEIAEMANVPSAFAVATFMFAPQADRPKEEQLDVIQRALLLYLTFKVDHDGLDPFEELGYIRGLVEAFFVSTTGHEASDENWQLYLQLLSKCRTVRTKYETAMAEIEQYLMNKA